MKHKYHNALKEAIRNDLTDTVKNNNLTIEKAAEILGISSRNFSNIKSGRFGCSVETFIAYIIKIRKDNSDLFDELSRILYDIDNSDQPDDFVKTDNPNNRNNCDDHDHRDFYDDFNNTDDPM